LLKGDCEPHDAITAVLFEVAVSKF
jgi:hypothetical protein